MFEFSRADWFKGMGDKLLGMVNEMSIRDNHENDASADHEKICLQRNRFYCRHATFLPTDDTKNGCIGDHEKI